MRLHPCPCESCMLWQTSDANVLQKRRLKSYEGWTRILRWTLLSRSRLISKPTYQFICFELSIYLKFLKVVQRELLAWLLQHCSTFWNFARLPFSKSYLKFTASLKDTCNAGSWPRVKKWLSSALVNRARTPAAVFKVVRWWNCCFGSLKYLTQT